MTHVLMIDKSRKNNTLSVAKNNKREKRRRLLPQKSLLPPPSQVRNSSRSKPLCFEANFFGRCFSFNLPSFPRLIFNFKTMKIAPLRATISMSTAVNAPNYYCYDKVLVFFYPISNRLITDLSWLTKESLLNRITPSA